MKILKSKTCAVFDQCYKVQDNFENLILIQNYWIVFSCFFLIKA